MICLDFFPFIKPFTAFNFQRGLDCVQGREGRSMDASVMISDSVTQGADFYSGRQNYGN